VLESAEYHGADRLLSLRLHDQLIKVRHAGREALPLGQPLSLGWPAERECRFASEDA
jgi:sn-glycerol 3-phosphate transport system ATP-binding protein